MAGEVRVVLRSLTGGRRGPSPEAPIHCFRCGLCCITRLPQLDQQDLEEVARGLGISQEALLRGYARPHPGRPGYYLLRRRGEGCVFLRREGNFTTCRIHPFKPWACRAWQASLATEECREGLKRLSGPAPLLPRQLYPQDQEAAQFLNR